jgi:protein-S-isoprenylcysteine O-methyltransferase Ste14
METRPEEKSFNVPSFAAHSTRGIIRDQKTRRSIMFALIGVALLMAVCGATFLSDVLNPRERLLSTALYWAACAWFTVTALLLALFDVLMLRAQGRAARRAFHAQVAAEESSRAE